MTISIQNSKKELKEWIAFVPILWKKDWSYSFTDIFYLVFNYSPLRNPDFHFTFRKHIWRLDHKTEDDESVKEKKLTGVYWGKTVLNMFAKNILIT
jgi:hypothetical protein